MDKREARRQAHEIVATLIEQTLTDGRFDDGSLWAPSQADHDRIEAELAAMATRHREASWNRRSRP